MYPLPPGLEIIPQDVLFQNSFSIRFDDENDSSSSTFSLSNINSELEEIERGTYPATLSLNDRITVQSHNQDVRHIELEIRDPTFPGYLPGDVLTVRPKNLKADVDEFLKYYGWLDIADKPLTILENI